MLNMKFQADATEENLRHFDGQEYRLIHDEIFLHGDVGESNPVQLFCAWNTEKVIYVTLDKNGERRNWESIKHPEKLNQDERFRVLNYCLSSFNKDEIVNYTDLFMQSEFVKEIN